MTTTASPASIITTGSKLPNGATVIDVRVNRSTPTSEEGVILARWGDEGYVTWRFQAYTGEKSVHCFWGHFTAHVDEKSVDCFWGHYFPSLEAAVQDFQAR